MKKQPNSACCFICGVENVAGVHVRFYNTVNEQGEPEVLARFTGQPVHQGYPGRMHGGVASGILDEVMGRAINAAAQHDHAHAHAHDHTNERAGDHSEAGAAENAEEEDADRYADTEWGVTADLAVRFRQPVPLGVELIARGRVTRDTRRLFEGAGELYLPDGSVAVTATGRYVKLKLDAIAASPEELGWRIYEDEEVRG